MNEFLRRVVCIWGRVKGKEFNVDLKAVYSAISNTRNQKKTYKKEETKTNKRQCPFNSVQVKICEGSPEGIRVTMKERICEREEF